MTRVARQSQVIWVIGWALTVANVLIVAASAGTIAAPASRLDVLRLDYAYYNRFFMSMRWPHPSSNTR